MTLAICTTCGDEKFGAFVPCKNCGVTPTSVAEKAKSITLSDHLFPPFELRKFSQMLKAGLQIPYDLFSLAICASNILSDDYYWFHRNAGREEFPCMECGKLFCPDQEEGLCPACIAATEQIVQFCPECVAVYDIGTQFCVNCGNRLLKSRSSVRSVAYSLLQGVDRLIDSRTLATAELGLYASELVKAWEEMRWLAIYPGFPFCLSGDERIHS